MTTSEPRALAAALSAPAFVTRGGGLATRVANRHVERWAPEAGASRMRPLRNLGFVDRLISPWLESAQRSPSLRMFDEYTSGGVSERATNQVSWLFPRPWYQDELDWMAAARHVGTQTAAEQASAPNMLTTRGTYVAPAHAHAQLALPTALHEYVAPSLSVARPRVEATADAYSPLVPFAATQAAHVMARAVAPLGAGNAVRMSPGLRSVLATMLERATHAPAESAPTRTSLAAPELVTPPAPRADAAGPGDTETTPAMQIADRYAEQHAQLAELQRLARAAAERELAARVTAERERQAAQAARTEPATEGQLRELRAAQERAVAQRQAALQERLGEAAMTRAAERDQAQTAERDAAAAAERARLEERIAQKLAAARQHEAQHRLHEQSRDAAARDARTAAAAPSAEGMPARADQPAQPRAESHVAGEIAAAVAALPPELSALVTASIGERPERAAQAIAELGEALRSVELIARTTAAGGSLEPIRGPRLVMPAGLGGLVATVERTASEPAHAALPGARGGVPVVARRPVLPLLRAPAAPASALAAASSSTPAALQHVAWSDRWLARFAGAQPQALAALSASVAAPDGRLQMLASSSPANVFVAAAEDRSRASAGELGFEVGFTPAAHLAEPLPTLRGGPVPAQPVLRMADDAETPDEMFAAISMAASRARATSVMPAAPAAAVPAAPSVDPDRHGVRESLADLVAHAAPAAPGAGLSAQLASSPFAPALRHVLPLGAAPSFDVRALFGAGLSASYLSGLIAPAGGERSLDSGDIEMPVVTPDAFEMPDAGLDASAGGDAQHYTTLRSALLASSALDTGRATTARSLVDSLSLPMLGAEAALGDAGTIDLGGASARAGSYAAPGMIADRAQAWSTAQERSSADLSFDFVPPELVLAARVYGLGPADAAQAARLAVSGSGQLAAMASTVDRTFVQAMMIAAERRGERGRTLTAYPAGEPDVAASEPAQPTTAFGVGRRAPRGAFLWPAATSAALGLTAPTPDGDHATSIAALELLAARTVAELGTYSVLGEVDRTAGSDGAATPASGSAPAGAEPRDEDVLATASAYVPASRRDKFQSLYVALGQSASARTWSPAARAARALALAGRGEDRISARERATVAWDVLPVVYGIGDAGDEPALSTGDTAARAVRRREELRALDPVLVDGRPGLSGLSARAGEALGAYVSPSAAPAASSSSAAREVGALLRPPTAAPELVETGRSAGRFGGGEV